MLYYIDMLQVKRLFSRIHTFTRECVSVLHVAEKAYNIRFHIYCHFDQTKHLVT